MEHTSKSEDRKETYPEHGAAFRASISFPPDLYETLEDIAKEKKVSLAWVVRDAVEKYVANENLTAIERAPKR
jgi:metal-responsive CopG/Arc/MetJ family transcriptional regulator